MAEQNKNPGAPSIEIHPFVEAVAHFLTPTTPDRLTRLALSDAGVKKVEELLRPAPKARRRAIEAQSDA
jgi:hypothetical protein